MNRRPLPLKVLSRLFSQFTRVRRSLYLKGRLKSFRMAHPVISVGNLSTGGTGKTPVVALISRILLANKFQPIVLSRGYKGKAVPATGILVSDGSEVLCSPDQCGDEPFLLAQQLPGAIVIAGKRRYQAARLAGSSKANRVYLLDDGYQHLKIARDLDLLVVDGTAPPWTDAVIPAGRLREPIDALAAAHAVILTRTHLLDSSRLEQSHQKIRTFNEPAPIFDFAHSLDSLQRFPEGPVEGLEYLGKMYWALLAAIGNPGQLVDDLEKACAVLKCKCLFRDHHDYSPEDLAQVARISAEKGANAILTTEKDAVRLKLPKEFPLPVYTLRIRTESCSPDFERWLMEELGKISFSRGTQSDVHRPSMLRGSDSEP